MHAGQTTLGIDEATLARAAETLRGGGLVAFPTETVYGLGANALAPTAVARIFEAKARPHFDPLIVHVAEVAEARRLTTHWPDIARALADAFWPGPMTLVLPKQSIVPDLVTAGLATVALRIPAHPVALALLRAAERPVAAPSANRFGGVSPTTAAHVQDELGKQVDMVLDGGACQTGVESTVISLVEAGPPRVLRLGGLAVERIEQVVGEVAIAKPQAAGREAEQRGQQSPGMLERHYAPRTPLWLVERRANFPSEAHHESGQKFKVGMLIFGRSAGDVKSDPRNREYEIAAVESLSATGDVVEAAANLFAAMRRLDALGLDGIVAERVPDKGLGRAINDRLRRAATR
ncbi:MAG: L-threonylcarbamoyladenylate synthase [Phycisphaeraceae bacterium]